MVVLKRLSDAISDNDRILAVIRGSAVNQDGRSTVLAAPNGLAQQALVRDALANAQLTPDRVGFVEAHGTATPLGDPIEVEALAATIGAPRPDQSSCYLGSAKANLGHLEAAAGVAGLIKTTLVLQHGEIPRQVHFTRLNPHLSLAGTCLAVADRHLAWPAGSLPRVAGVSGFGVGGTNAHVLVEEAPVLPPPTSEQARRVASCWRSPRRARPPFAHWPLHGSTFFARRSESTASLTCHGWRSTLALRPPLGDRRPHERATRDPAARLRRWRDHAGRCCWTTPGRGGDTRVAFVFSGQGPQWPRMGAELAAREPVFRDTLADLDARFRRLAGWSLASALAEPAESSRLHETEVAQPAIFAIQVALAALWDLVGSASRRGGGPQHRRTRRAVTWRVCCRSTMPCGSCGIAAASCNARRGSVAWRPPGSPSRKPNR